MTLNAQHSTSSPYIHIVAESDDWIVVDKPPHLEVHPSKPRGSVTLWDELRELLAFEIINGGQVSIINRLDRETSGVTLIAKHHEAARTLHREMEGRAVEKEVKRDGFSVIRELGGHGIGRTIHEKPRVPNFADTTATEFLSEGMVITIEPIIAAGKGEVQTQRDGWTVCTVDCSRSAHYEHTIVITRGRPIILTAA